MASDDFFSVVVGMHVVTMTDFDTDVAVTVVV
eukprot:CAMPEP_0172828938 /NCGR_PEP_ID=MMETSP1075-20121228/21184_1 /TAXON_ID=2916 /ORGANISM="Ceratium fusus, Strain PA161109" /LENGTH=31 /DNA_ID= /DNA_START= /DNA_END= /DNA_ORIENTATION=